MRQILYLFLIFSVQAPAWSEQFSPKNLGTDAIYGIDDRELVTDKSPKAVKQIAQAVAMIVSSSVLDKNLLKTTIIATTLKETLNMCVGENFITKPSLSSCTGFLIASNLVATAGHCFKTAEDCLDKKIIFDVDAKKQSRKGYSVSGSTIFNCAKIIAQEESSDRDYAIIQLDRAPKNRVPLKFSKDKNIANDAHVFMIGHPLGLPQILSKEVAVNDNSDVHMFKTPLDSFEGNSGSPVINSKTLLVEGILVNGQEDFILDSELGCYRNINYESAGGEGVSRINDLLPFLK